MTANATKTLETKPVLSLKKEVGPIEMSVEILIFLFFKAFSAMRTYSSEHPLFQNSLQHLSQTFDEFFEAQDTLLLELTESEIFFNGQGVYQEEEKRGSIIFMLFHDGVREIRFEKGLTADEIKELLEAFKVNADLPQEERDIVSLLWSKDFDHIHYFAFDEIPDQAVDYVDQGIARLENNAPEIDPTDVAAMAGEVQAQMESRGAENTQLASSIKPAILSQLMAKSQDAIEDLLESLSEEKNFDPESELLGIIFDILHLEENTDRSQSVLKLLENYSDDLLARGDFAQVNKILQGLHMFFDLGKTDAVPLTRHVDEMLNRFAEEKIHALRKTLTEGTMAQTNELRSFIALLRPIAIDPVCDLLEDVSGPKIRSILCQGLETLARGQTSRLGQLLESASEPVAKEIVSVLGKIGDDSATAILKKCVDHPSAAVRDEAIRALRSISTLEARDAMVLFITDEDSAIRTAAAEGVENCEVPCHADPILPIVREKTFFKQRREHPCPRGDFTEKRPV